MIDGKKPIQSKTLVLNGVMGLIAFVALFIPGAEDLHGWINAHATEIGIGWSVLNIILRAITSDRIVLGD